MTRIPMRKILGAKDLIQDAVDGGLNASERVHQAITGVPYALLGRIEPIAAPVKTAEYIQHSVTAGIYQTIRSVNLALGSAATQIINQLELHAETRAQASAARIRLTTETRLKSLQRTGPR